MPLSRVRVLLVAQDPRAPGGVSNYLRILRLRLRERMEVRRLASGRRQGEKGPFRMLARLLHDQLRFAKAVRSGFDIVQFNPSMDFRSFPREVFYSFLVPHGLTRPRLVLFYRGWNWHVWRTLQSHWVPKQLVKLVHHRMDAILVLSASFEDALERAGVPRSKIRLVTTMFDGASLAPELVQRSKDPNRIVFMSRFLPAKGGLLALKAFAEARSTAPHSKLAMVGDGPDRFRLEAEADALGIADAVEFTGYLQDREKMAELARSTIFLFPSTHPEGMPNALLEAMAAGNAVIASRAGAIPEIVADEQQMISTVSSEELAGVLIKFLAQPLETADRGRRNREVAWSTWESQAVADRMANLYLELGR